MVERVEVEPFTGPEMAEYVAAVTGRAPSPEAVDALLARSEGNPYVAEQLLSCTGGTADALPGVVADLVLGRVEALPDDARTVVRIASVAGGRVPHDLLALVSGLDAERLDAGLREAVAAQVLVPAGDG